MYMHVLVDYSTVLYHQISPCMEKLCSQVYTSYQYVVLVHVKLVHFLFPTAELFCMVQNLVDVECCVSFIIVTAS